MPRPTVPAVLHHQSRHRGDHPLLGCDGERLSYAQADQQSTKLARGLIALGAGKGTHVGLLYPNGAAFDEAAVRERLAGELSAYKIPRRFAVLPRPEIPLLSSGKVDIQRLTKVFDA
jgi:acyl-CoA synthetase (AMP-forming)/AMP-acid ligase II